MTMGGPAYRDFKPAPDGLSDDGAFRRSGLRAAVRQPRFDQQRRHRTISTVAPQALFLLNTRFLLEQTRSAGKRHARLLGKDTARIQQAYPLSMAAALRGGDQNRPVVPGTRSRASSGAKTPQADRGYSRLEGIARSCRCANELSM